MVAATCGALAGIGGGVHGSKALEVLDGADLEVERGILCVW